MARTIKTIPAGGGSSEIVADVKGAYVTASLTWSPGGTKIAYDYNTEKIRVISVKNRSVTEVSTGLAKAKPFAVSWSPDGERIAFSAYRPGEISFYLMKDFLSPTKAKAEEPSDHTP